MSDAVIQPDHIDAGRAHALAGLLDRDEPPALGEPLPLLWHLAYFLTRPAQADLGQDGHPITGFPTPPREGMRRMFAGGRVTTTSGLCVGDDALATTRVSSRTDKQGRTGPIHLVTTRTDITVGDRLAVVDERDIVYLEPASSTGEPSHANDDTPPLDMITRNSLAHRRVTVDPVLLFRFSALTYNAHRIHYDLTYARDVEGHTGLVVHGPLQALVMAELARSLRPSLDGCTFSYRLTSPLYHGQGMTVVATTDDDVSVIDDHGRTTATALISPIQ